MKSKKSASSGKSTAISQDHDHLNEILLEILPVIFHKLKNKLTPIIGYAQILKARGADEFTCERLAKIENSASELTDLLNILKDYFKTEATVKELKNLNRLLDDMLPAWKKKAAAEQITVRLDLDPALPEIPLHAGQVRLLLRNLAANAFTALALKGAPQKELALTTRLQNGRARLTVRDNGIGISHEERDHIWSPFHAQFPGGAGLGLVLCEKVLANHGASYRVSSQPGEFSEFTIDFPLPGEGAAQTSRSDDSDRGQQIKEDA